VATLAPHGHGAHHDDAVYHQFETYDQQTESYVVGMWCFLVTEIMFFGALFLVYTLYRWQFQKDFFAAHHELDVMMGGVNTMVLLTSSFTMALAVHYAQLKETVKQQKMLFVTLVCAFAFLVIKGFEWKAKFEHHHVMGPNFQWNVPNTSPEHAQMFFSLYFGMTGLHAFHVIIGIGVIGALMYLTHKKAESVRDYIPTEMIGLYWHFVDIVWIFLFPLYYLMPQ